MNLIACPYCRTRGLAIKMKALPGGFEVSRKCLACGYACDSHYTPAEMPEDVMSEALYVERRADRKSARRGPRGSRRSAARLASLA